MVAVLRRGPGQPRAPAARTAGEQWERGRFTTIDAPGAAATVAFGIDNSGQIVGTYENPNPAPSPRPTAMGLAGTA